MVTHDYSSYLVEVEHQVQLANIVEELIQNLHTYTGGEEKT